MNRQFAKVWIHLVFGTQDRAPLIGIDLELQIHTLLRAQLLEMHCIPVAINGMADHVHLLFGLNPEKSIAEVVQQLKVGSSRALAASGLSPVALLWDAGYGTVSVSETMLPVVKTYLKDQRAHHREDNLIPELEIWEIEDEFLLLNS